MITDVDIKKMKPVFVTKDDLKKELKTLTKYIETKFATKEALKALDSKVDSGFLEVIKFIGEIKNDLMKELIDFRDEMRDINRNTQSALNNQESRIAHLEYVNK